LPTRIPQTFANRAASDQRGKGSAWINNPGTAADPVGFRVNGMFGREDHSATQCNPHRSRTDLTHQPPADLPSQWCFVTRTPKCAAEDTPVPSQVLSPTLNDSDLQQTLRLATDELSNQQRNVCCLWNHGSPYYAGAHDESPFSGWILGKQR